MSTRLCPRLSDFTLPSAAGRSSPRSDHQLQWPQDTGVGSPGLAMTIAASRQGRPVPGARGASQWTAELTLVGWGRSSEYLGASPWWTSGPHDGGHWGFTMVGQERRTEDSRWPSELTPAGWGPGLCTRSTPSGRGLGSQLRNVLHCRPWRRDQLQDIGAMDARLKRPGPWLWAPDSARAQIRPLT